MSFTPYYSITNTITASLIRIEWARGFLDAAKLSEEWIESMRSRAFLLEAHDSIHIEGRKNCFPPVEALIDSNTFGELDFEKLATFLRRNL